MPIVNSATGHERVQDEVQDECKRDSASKRKVSVCCGSLHARSAAVINNQTCASSPSKEREDDRSLTGGVNDGVVPITWPTSEEVAYEFEASLKR